MKRLGIVLLCICAFSLLACGSVKRNYDKDNDDTEVKESSEYVSEDFTENETETTKDPFENVQLVWGDKLETSDMNPLFQYNDIKEKNYDGREKIYCYFENENRSARLEEIDTFNMYLSYNSSDYIIDKVAMESFQDNYYGETEFYEEDLNKDVKPELIIIGTLATGTECNENQLYIYDDEEKGFKAMFPSKASGTAPRFTEKQKADITAQIMEWDKNGFLQACDRTIDELLVGDIFIPRLVKYNNEIKIEVKFINFIHSRKVNTYVSLVALFGVDKDMNLTLENLSCEIKPK